MILVLTIVRERKQAACDDLFLFRKLTTYTRYQAKTPLVGLIASWRLDLPLREAIVFQDRGLLWANKYLG